MRGGTEVRPNALRLANALDDAERAYRENGDARNVNIIADALNYCMPQMLDDMHDLLTYIYALERQLGI